MRVYSPPFVTETDERPPWLDCTWAAGLMFANMATEGEYPSTRAEREALRHASGDVVAGSSLWDLNRGLRARYGWGIPDPGAGVSESSLLSRLRRGYGAVAQGSYALLPPHYQRWDRAFANGRNPLHAVYVQGHDRGGNYHLDARGNLVDVFWVDPLGRSPAGTPAAERYRGEWMPVPVFLRFLSALGRKSARYACTVKQGSEGSD